MTIKQRYKGVIEWFEHNVPVAETDLHYRSPFELLVAVELSVHTTDKPPKHATHAPLAGFTTHQHLA